MKLNSVNKCLWQAGSFEAPCGLQIWRQQRFLSAVSALLCNVPNFFIRSVNTPETVRPRRFGITAKTPVNSREFTVNLVNLTYLSLSGGFGSWCLLLGCFWQLKELKCMHCTCENIMLRSCIFLRKGRDLLAQKEEGMLLL
jgi:hypothetical protein